MSNRTVERYEFADGAELAPAFADWTADLLRKAIAARGAALLVVSGGETPLRYFLALSKRQLDWSRVTVTLADERRVPDDHPRSNARLVRNSLLQREAAAAHFAPLADSRLTPEQELASARTRLASLPLPADLVVLGMGEDGHTASWFPGAPRARAAAHADRARHSTRASAGLADRGAEETGDPRPGARIWPGRGNADPRPAASGRRAPDAVRKRDVVRERRPPLAFSKENAEPPTVPRTTAAWRPPPLNHAARDFG